MLTLDGRSFLVNEYCFGMLVEIGEAFDSEAVARGLLTKRELGRLRHWLRDYWSTVDRDWRDAESES